MKNLTPKYICLIMCLSIAQVSHAQKLKDFIKKTTQEIEAGVTDAVAKAMADKIVEKAVASFSGKLDTLLDSAFKLDSTSRAERCQAVASFSGKLDTLLDSAFKLDSTSRAERGDTINYFEFLNGLNESDKVPDQYAFHLGFETINTDDNGRETKSTQYFHEEGAYFGMLTEGTLTVMDPKNEILASFNLEEKKRFCDGQINDAICRCIGWKSNVSRS